MRTTGLAVIIGGSLATAGAMFFTAFDYQGFARLESLNWWESFQGLDIALAAACAAAGGLAVAALISRGRMIAQLAGIAAAVLFGLAFAAIPDTIDDQATRAGLWIVGGTGAVVLVGGVLVVLSKPD